MKCGKRRPVFVVRRTAALKVMVEDNRIVKVRPDKENPRSQGYNCRKGLKISHYQNHEDRLKRPLKRVGDEFQEVSWDQALGEIAEKLKSTVDAHGPRSLAYMGGGGQGGHFEAAFGVRLLRGLGSHYHYSPLAQELTGYFWVNGRALGRQYLRNHSGSRPDGHAGGNRLERLAEPSDAPGEASFEEDLGGP